MALLIQNNSLLGGNNFPIHLLNVSENGIIMPQNGFVGQFETSPFVAQNLKIVAKEFAGTGETEIVINENGIALVKSNSAILVDIEGNLLF